MNSYSLFKDILDTYQSFDQVMQILWLVVPCVTLVMLVALFLRYRLARQLDKKQALHDLPYEERMRLAEEEFREYALRNNTDQRWVHPFLWDDQSSGRVIAYPAPIEGAPVLMALLDYADYPSGKKG